MIDTITIMKNCIHKVQKVQMDSGFFKLTGGKTEAIKPTCQEEKQEAYGP